MGFFDQLKDNASQAGEKAGAALKDAKSKMSEGMADAKAKMDEHKALAAEAKAPIEGSIARYQVFHTQIGVGNRLDGGRRRVKKYLWSFFRTAPAGQVRL